MLSPQPRLNSRRLKQISAKRPISGAAIASPSALRDHGPCHQVVHRECACAILTGTVTMMNQVEPGDDERSCSRHASKRLKGSQERLTQSSSSDSPSGCIKADALGTPTARSPCPPRRRALAPSTVPRLPAQGVAAATAKAISRGVRVLRRDRLASSSLRGLGPQPSYPATFQPGSPC